MTVDDLALPAWWRQGPEPKTYHSVCYRTKTEALRVFADWNARVIQAWGGLTNVATGGEFDSVNEKFGLRGKRRVKTLADALWHALPPGSPFCLDRIDLDVLNETTPGRDLGPFTLPDHVVEAELRRREAEWYSRGEMAGLRRRNRRLAIDCVGLRAAIAEAKRRGRRDLVTKAKALGRSAGCRAA